MTEKVSSMAGSAQDVGGAEFQRERVRTGIVQTADGGRILLCVVAAGSRTGKSAERVVEQVFQTVSGSQSGNLAAALKRGLEIASQSLARQGEEVTSAAAAIRRNRIFFANTGNNAVFRVVGQEAIRLTQPSKARLGTIEAPRIQSGPEEGLMLQRGDRIVVASAGLLETNPADEKPFVDPHDIPEHIKNLPPEDAAKHLVSMALGRDVTGNASIAVLGEAKGARRWPLVVAGAIGILLLVVGAIALIGTPNDDPITDFGFAVLVRGGVLADSGDGVPGLVGNLDTIPAGSALSAQTDAALGLQSTHEGSSELTRSNVYLEQAADLRLSEIDLDGASGKTRLELGGGSILVSRLSGTWEFQVDAVTETAILSGAGPGAMGVGTSGGSIQLDCLIGICRYEPPTGNELLLSGGDRVLVGASSGIAQQSAIPSDSIAQWDELCGGCIP